MYDFNTWGESEEDSLLKYTHIKFIDDNIIGHTYVQSKTGSLNQGDDTKFNFLRYL